MLVALSISERRCAGDANISRLVARHVARLVALLARATGGQALIEDQVIKIVHLVAPRLRLVLPGNCRQSFHP